MKPFKLRFSPKQDNFVIVDKGKRVVHALEGEQRVQDIVNIFQDKDKQICNISVKFSLDGDSWYCVPINLSHVSVFNPHNNWKKLGLVIELDLSSVDNIYYWVSRGLIMYGKDRMDAIPIKRENFKIEFNLNKS